MSAQFENLMQGDLCAGCGACSAIAPAALDMRITDAGFLRPHMRGALDQAKVDMIAKVCPGHAQRIDAGSRRNDPVWGPYLSAYTGYARDDALRALSASGGALSAMLVSILSRGVVDGVVQTGRNPNNPLQNETYVSRTAKDVQKAAGSRYAPSSPLDVLPHVLGDGMRYAFVGKPCDVAALSELRKQDAGVAESFPILISFLCAGVPSQAGAEAVVTQMQMDPKTVTHFDFRGTGWPGQATARDKRGRIAHMSYAASWGDILSKHLQHRCKICADGSGMFADLVFGDVWQSDANGYPSFQEQPGQSLILVRSDTGAQLLRDAAPWVAHRYYDLDKLHRVQPGQVRRRQAVLARLAGLRLMGRPIPRYRGFGLWRMACSNALKTNARNFLGMARRVWQQRGSGAC